MSELSTNKIESALIKKGFRFDKDKTNSMSHRVFYFYDVNGNKTSIFTYLSHSSNSIGDTLISRMAKQLHLKNGEFKNMINCFISHNEYNRLLIKNKVQF